MKTSIESLTWIDEEILPRLNKIIDRYPDAQMYLTGSIVAISAKRRLRQRKASADSEDGALFFEIDDPEQISIQAKP
jgi:hypothetical protein